MSYLPQGPSAPAATAQVLPSWLSYAPVATQVQPYTSVATRIIYDPLGTLAPMQTVLTQTGVATNVAYSVSYVPLEYDGPEPAPDLGTLFTTQQRAGLATSSNQASAISSSSRATSAPSASAESQASNQPSGSGSSSNRQSASASPMTPSNASNGAAPSVAGSSSNSNNNASESIASNATGSDDVPSAPSQSATNNAGATNAAQTGDGLGGAGSQTAATVSSPAANASSMTVMSVAPNTVSPASASNQPLIPASTQASSVSSAQPLIPPSSTGNSSPAATPTPPTSASAAQASASLASVTASLSSLQSSLSAAASSNSQVSSLLTASIASANASAASVSSALASSQSAISSSADAMTSATSDPSGTSNRPMVSSNGASQSGLSDGQIAGITVGAILAAVLLLLLLLGLCVFRRRRRTNGENAAGPLTGDRRQARTPSAYHPRKISDRFASAWSSTPQGAAGHGDWGRYLALGSASAAAAAAAAGAGARSDQDESERETVLSDTTGEEDRTEAPQTEAGHTEAGYTEAEYTEGGHTQAGQTEGAYTEDAYTTDHDQDYNEPQSTFARRSSRIEPFLSQAGPSDSGLYSSPGFGRRMEAGSPSLSRGAMMSTRPESSSSNNMMAKWGSGGGLSLLGGLLGGAWLGHRSSSGGQVAPSSNLGPGRSSMSSQSTNSDERETPPSEAEEAEVKYASIAKPGQTARAQRGLWGLGRNAGSKPESQQPLPEMRQSGHSRWGWWAAPAAAAAGGLAAGASGARGTPRGHDRDSSSSSTDEDQNETSHLQTRQSPSRALAEPSRHPFATGPRRDSHHNLRSPFVGESLPVPPRAKRRASSGMTPSPTNEGALGAIASQHRESSGSTYSRGNYPSGGPADRHSTFLSTGTHLLGPRRSVIGSVMSTSSEESLGERMRNENQSAVMYGAAGPSHATRSDDEDSVVDPIEWRDELQRRHRNLGASSPRGTLGQRRSRSLHSERRSQDPSNGTSNETRSSDLLEASARHSSDTYGDRPGGRSYETRRSRESSGSGNLLTGFASGLRKLGLGRTSGSSADARAQEHASGMRASGAFDDQRRLRYSLSSNHGPPEGSRGSGDSRRSKDGLLPADRGSIPSPEPGDSPGLAAGYEQDEESSLEGLDDDDDDDGERHGNGNHTDTGDERFDGFSTDHSNQAAMGCGDRPLSPTESYVSETESSSSSVHHAQQPTRWVPLDMTRRLSAVKEGSEDESVAQSQREAAGGGGGGGDGGGVASDVGRRSFSGPRGQTRSWWT